MTSKKALENLYRYDTHLIKGEEYIFVDIKSGEWNVIKKDLEALEKIKSNFDIWIYKDEINIQAKSGGQIATIKGKDVEFFEEWLNNDL